MLYLYMDESGDLGFDFVNKKPSNFFTIAILVIRGVQANRSIINAVKKTLRRKLNPKNKRNRVVQELKAVNSTLSVKQYFFDLISEEDFLIYSMTLNKRRVYTRLAENKSRVYNFIARKVLDQIPFEHIQGERVQFFIDKSKSKPEILDFNQYIQKQLEGRIDPRVPLNIFHQISQTTPGLQAIDLFAHGIFGKHEKSQSEWYDHFKNKIAFDSQYL